MDKLLIDAGWIRQHGQLFTHAMHGELYRDGRNGRWYLRRGQGVPEEMAREKLRDAIPKVLAATQQGVLA